MKITYQWLKEYIDVPWDWRELADRLTMSGLALESAREMGEGLDEVVVGRVLERKRHPNADRLSVCKVDTGDKGIYEIVCGAPNVAAGQKVPLILPGNRTPGGRVIEAVSLRGVLSSGMICSEKELELGEDGEGIMVLSPETPVGSSLSRALGLDDVLLDFEVTPNRPDCMSVVGVAREVSALTGHPVRFPPLSLSGGDRTIGDFASVDIEDEEGCPRYAARVVTGVRVGPSPGWLRRRLESIGLRPINNVVDLTNFVLMELGHPLHAFDLNRLTDRRIVVRRARSGERIRTLDGTDRDLTPDILVIADAERPVAVAGVMGGADSEVTESTTDILLESAFFDPKRVRRGRRLLNLSSEASLRFERGADFDAPVRALDRVAGMIQELAGGVCAAGHIDVYPRPLSPSTVELRTRRANEVLGTDLSSKTIRRILSQLGCQVTGVDGKLGVTVPSYRPDLIREADLVEEVARIYGYDRIKSRGVRAWKISIRRSREERLRERILSLLTGLGLTEVVTNTLIDDRWISASGGATTPVELSNPVSPQASVLRPALLPSLLNVARWNLNRKVERIRIFELGKIFLNRQSGNGPEERVEVAGLLIGPRESTFWEEAKSAVDYFDLKGILEQVFEQLTTRVPTTPRAESPTYEPGPSAEVRFGGEVVGSIGQVRRSIAQEFDIEIPVFAFSLDFEKLLSGIDERRAFTPPPRFPGVERDFAFVVKEEVEAGGLLSVIQETAGTMVESIEVFDLYRGENIPENHKSVALALKFRAPDRTLSEAEVDGLCERILDRLKETSGAELRTS